MKMCKMLCLAVMVAFTALGLGEAAASEALLQEKCVGCHSLDLVTKAKKGLSQWETTIDRMTNYGTKLTPEEKKAIASYLSEKSGALGEKQEEEAKEQEWPPVPSMFDDPAWRQAHSFHPFTVQAPIEGSVNCANCHYEPISEAGRVSCDYCHGSTERIGVIKGDIVPVPKPGGLVYYDLQRSENTKYLALVFASVPVLLYVIVRITKGK